MSLHCVALFHLCRCLSKLCYTIHDSIGNGIVTQVPDMANWKSIAPTWVIGLIPSPNLKKEIIKENCYFITMCSFLYFFMKVCLISPVVISLVVHMASVVQTMQGYNPCADEFHLHHEVGLSFISPSFIRVFLVSSKSSKWMFSVTQHLKRPPFSPQDFANLDCSWKIEFLNFRS